jgi:SpoVK/Ycf46/Vps4 family AAA+-type ATPase
VDRYSNLEVNYLLQKMEAYDGIVILTTNLEQGIDEAFKRRLRFKIKFPFPDAELRLLLWQSMVPPEALRERELELDWLARDFEMAGANIKNTVLRAAFNAAEQGIPISAQLLRRAAVQEYKEMGKLVREEVDDDEL